ncbi:MAG: TPM domain-containing protein [Bacteroidales bacterium]|nr:TPM domain-containing protein [Bacteroidales bacterium]
MEEDTKKTLVGCGIFLVFLGLLTWGIIWFIGYIDSLPDESSNPAISAVNVAPDTLYYQGGWEKYVVARRNSSDYHISKKFITDSLTNSKISAAMSTPYVDSSLKVYDAAGLLGDLEYEMVQRRVKQFINSTGLDMAIVTTDFNPKKAGNGNQPWEEFAIDFYEYNDFGTGATTKYGYNGVVMAIDMQYRAVSVFDFGELYYTYKVARNNYNQFLDHIEPNVKTGRYVDAMLVFVDDYENQYHASVYSYEHRDEENAKTLNLILWIVIGSVVGFVMLCVGLPIAFLKNGSPHTGSGYDAKDYIVENSFTVTYEDEKVIGSKAKPRETYSSHSYHSGRSSGSHRTSSGRHAGGGSRRF